jgi:hypothetical protein
VDSTGAGPGKSGSGGDAVAVAEPIGVAICSADGVCGPPMGVASADLKSPGTIIQINISAVTVFK